MGVAWTFFSPLSFLSCFSLSLGDGPIYTEILSQRAAKPKSTNFEIAVFEISRVDCINIKKSRPGCSKLTTSLVNVSLKVQMLISQICQYFLLKIFEKTKASLIFFNKKYQCIWLLRHKTLNELTS